MPDFTLEQRVEWLQNGLREIGRMCLTLGGGSSPGPAVSVPAPTVSAPVHTAPTPQPSMHEGPPIPSAPFAATIPLSQFMAGVLDLTPQERLTAVQAAIAMLGEVYVHLPLKRAMHGIDPLQKLRLLRQRLQRQIDHNEPDDGARVFHDAMIEIFHSLRDLHTNYVLPASYQGRTAFLPFLLEECYEGTPQRRVYLVTRLQPGFTHPTFVPGVEVTHWNGTPIDRAVQRNAEREAGSNEEARHARGLEALTLRPMALTAPPDESWVIIQYRAGGQAQEVRFEWQVALPASSSGGSLIDVPAAMVGEAGRLLGYDARTEAVRRARKSLFFPDAMGKEFRMAQAMAAATIPGAAAMYHQAPLAAGPTAAASTLGYDVKAEALRTVKTAMRTPDIRTAQRDIAAAEAVASAAPVADGPSTTSLLPDFFGFRTVNTPSGVFGYIRIYSFMISDANSFVAEFVRIAGLLPQNGLIVDVRGNGGGNINAGESLLQVLTPGKIEPEPFHFINTPTTLRLCNSAAFLSDWVESIDLAVQTGEVYSQGFPLTPDAQANASLGYHYPGPVVLVIDALCYSTTDIFSAGFQDHGVGKILGADARTGAGGANVWPYEFFQGLEGFPDLPKGVGFRTAIRRSTRVHSRAGVPLEDLGVRPDSVHRMTRADILQGNPDLIAAAAQFLV